MKIVALVENTTTNKELKPQHGLSFYVETKNHKILIDLGCDRLFLENAHKIGIDIEAIDIVVLSHGHYDHVGGLKYFLRANKTAKVFIQQSAFVTHKKPIALGGLIKVDIGIKKIFEKHPQVVLLDGDYKIDDEIQLITKPNGHLFMPKQNNMLAKKNGKYIADNFEHEQSIVISEEKSVLFSGCSHRGIVNIVEHVKSKIDKPIDFCIGGFHLFTLTQSQDDKQILLSLASQLDKHNIKYYTCHCTGKYAYDCLKLELGDKIDYISTGQVVIT